MNDLHADHGISFDRKKRRHLVRLTLWRGSKVVGKRVMVRVQTADPDIARMVRDSLLDMLLALGVRVIRRAKQRDACGGEARSEQ